MALGKDPLNWKDFEKRREDARGHGTGTTRQAHELARGGKPRHRPHAKGDAFAPEHARERGAAGLPPRPDTHRGGKLTQEAEEASLSCPVARILAYEPPANQRRRLE